MSVLLPPLPGSVQLADLCREVAALESVQPELVEKDFYLTRLLWALGDSLGEQLLLKGGTLLSKVDLGFYRMSEDADLVIPIAASRVRGSNMRRINHVRDALAALEAMVGVKRRFPSGDDSNKGAHRVWRLDYPSEFGKQHLQLEVSLRPALRGSRRVQLRQLLQDPLIGDYSAAFCWALDADEARAEKVRAAFTREAIRDYYDLDRLADAGLDLTSEDFLGLVNEKLREIGAPSMEKQNRPFGLDASRRAVLERSLQTELPAVLRANAPPFDLDRMLTRFEALWAFGS